jgi:hypothetical protein
VTQDNATPDGGTNAKGKPTPSRKEAEAARKKAMKTPLTRKEQLRREREARAQLRQRQQEALRSGRGADLPPRDRGPVRAFARDHVDRRRNVAEYLLPILVSVLLLSFVKTPLAQLLVFYAWAVMLLLTIIDEVVMVRGLKRGLRERFPDVPTKGATGYAVLRSTQLRRFRLPSPTIERGAPLRDRY